eukprot:TRINITY_DN9186_c0_g1_i1.p3 TRINITY_DN9186_c0_g1~~TRINITY_DN9186_c0_g1_i1.p3  ORF type:complete len:201 (+),score=40.13 TRINITY_DN9186_c0_g1_i1:32-604(+)
MASNQFMSDVEDELKRIESQKNTEEDSEKRRKLLENVQSELICAICLDVYEIPTVIGNCLHTFCKECIASLGEKYIECPLCKQKYTLFFGIDDLKKNFQLANIIDHLPDSEKVRISHQAKVAAPPKPEHSLLDDFMRKDDSADDVWKRMNAEKSESDLFNPPSAPNFKLESFSDVVNKILERPGHYLNLK